MMFTKVEEQKEYALKILERLSIIDPDIVIGGGAPRDWHFGRLAKDFDIYVQGKTFEDYLSVGNRIEKLGIKLKDVTASSPEYTGKSDNGVLGVYNVVNLYHPVQIIVCDRFPSQMVNTFMTSISKIYMTKYGNTYKDSTFDIGKEYNCIFIEENADPKYINKILQKFPNMQPIYQPIKL